MAGEESNGDEGEEEKTITLDREDVENLIQQMIKDNAFLMEENAILRSRIADEKRFFRVDWDNIVNLDRVVKIEVYAKRTQINFHYQDGKGCRVEFKNEADLNAAMNAIAPIRYGAMKPK